MDWAEGTFPTPRGLVSVRHLRSADGAVESEIEAPADVELVRREDYAQSA